MLKKLHEFKTEKMQLSNKEAQEPRRINNTIKNT